MKLDIDEREQWTPEQHEFAANCAVYLDGKEMTHVTVFDEELGYIKRYKTEGDDVFIDPDGNDVVIERLEGKVEVFDKRKGVLHA